MRVQAWAVRGCALAIGCGDDTAPPSNDFSTVHDLSASAGDFTSGATQQLARTDLTSDQAGAAHTKANLVNAWGLAFNPAGPAWIASNGQGVAVVLDSSGTDTGLVVTIPTAAGGTPPSAPTGQVFNGSTAFMGDLFILSTEEGGIARRQTRHVAGGRAGPATPGAN